MGAGAAFFGFFSFTSHSGSTCWGSFHHSTMAAWIAPSSPLRDFTSASRSFRLCSGQASRNWIDRSSSEQAWIGIAQMIWQNEFIYLCVVEVRLFQPTRYEREGETKEETDTRVRCGDIARSCALWHVALVAQWSVVPIRRSRRRQLCSPVHSPILGNDIK